MSDIDQNINNIFNKSFIDTYLSDIFITFILLIVFLTAISYFYVMNNIGPIIADWDNKKCSPSVMPFAGLINNGPNTSKLEFTKQNFSSCMHTMVSVMSNDALQPIHYVLNSFTKIFTDLKDVLNDIRAEFNKVRETIHMFSADVMGRALNVTMPILQMVVGIKTALAKVNGVLGATQYTLFGSYLSLKAMFMFFLKIVNDMLIALVATIVATLILAIFFFPAFDIAFASIAIMVAILIPSLLIQSFVSEIFNLHTPSFPSVPSCFDANTCLKMEDNTEKRIADIKPGDILPNNIKISVVLKCSAQGQKMYCLDKVFVTGEHRVFHKLKGWIKVKDHEESILMPAYNEPFVYCLITDSKLIHINNTVFSDWDDIDMKGISELEKKCIAKGYLPEDFNGNDIHVYLENGLDGNTSYIQMKNDQLVLLRDIQVNDILNNGARVVGIVHINMADINTIYEYSSPLSDANADAKADAKADASLIRCCQNIQIILNDENGDIKAKKNMIEHKEELIVSENLNNNNFYQLLVEGGSFIVNGIKVGDYNTGLDKFLL